MNYELIAHPPQLPKVIPAQAMQCGDIGIVQVDPTDALRIAVGINDIYSRYYGMHILRTYNGYVSLDNPNLAWSFFPSFDVVLLAEGEQLILTGIPRE